MSGTEDEVLLIFLEESREHLAGIEEDLLAVEEAGANIDQDLVNRVFRAIHTIKGGSGFFALDRIKDLSHVMENVLDLIRKERLLPDKEVINTLLNGSDLLRSMINNPSKMDSVDIGPCTKKLEEIRQGKPASAGQTESEPEESKLIPILGPLNQTVFEISESALQRAKKEEKGGNLVYLVEYDLIHDIERKNKNPWDVIKEALTLTFFIDSKVDFSAIGSLEDASEEMKIPFYILLTTVMDRNLLSYFLGLPEEKIHEIDLGHQVEAEEPVQAQEKPAQPQPVEAPKEASIQSQPIEAPKSEVQEMKPVQSEVERSPIETAKKVDEAVTGGKKFVKGEGSVRVNLKVLDKLMTLAGELVLTRNQLLQSGSEGNLQAMHTASQSVDHLTTELQDAIMATRMQSIGLVFNKFKRIVRDMSNSLGKSIDLTLEGEDVELDRTIIEKIGDPLTHLVRNSVDHGIEMPDIRTKMGKKTQGSLHLRATHEAGFVVIDIIDDGKGIPIDAIKRKALESGVVTAMEADSMTEKDVQMLIFKPGFSTAKEITEISGRGVGMDVVKTNINDLGGIVDLESTEGVGTRMQIKLPLTLAILPSLMIEVQGARFAIPQANLLELVRITARDVKNRIEMIGDAPVMRLRGELLPLVSMREVLGIRKATWTDENGAVHFDRRANIADRRSVVHGKEDSSEKTEDVKKRNQSDRRVSPNSSINIVVVLAGDMKIGLIVDHLLDSSEIVVKPLGCHLKSAKIYAGATILGDGSVALILDLFGIRRFMKLDQVSLTEQTEKETMAQAAEGLKDTHELLIVENGDDEFFAIPLDLVLRIEKIKTSDIQITGGQKAIKYRGGSLGLFAIEDVATVKPRTDSDIASIIVFKVANREVGILVKLVVDIIQTNVEIDGMTHKQTGIFGSAVIHDRITLFLDLFGIVKEMAPQWVKEFQAASKEDAVKGKTILLVEDSKFFTAQISEFLMEAGYKVLTALDGNLGLEVMAKQGKDIDLIITDIEMPNMDGFEMVTRLRKNPEYAEMPMIAVTSVSGERARNKGLTVGMDAYLIKLDREEILHHINGYLNHGRTWKK